MKASYWRTRITLEVASFAWHLYRRIQMFRLCRRLYGWRRAVNEFVYGTKP